MTLRVRATLRLQNDVMITTMKAREMTLDSLYELTGVPVGSISDMRNLHFSRKTGSPACWRRRADAVSLVLEIPSETLVPPELIGEDITPIVRIGTCRPAELLAIRSRMSNRLLADSETPMIVDESRSIMDKVMCSCLTENEQTVLKMRLGWDGEEPATFSDIAQSLGRSSGRVQQIEARAVRKLQHPARLRELKGVHDLFDPDPYVTAHPQKTPSGCIHISEESVVMKGEAGEVCTCCTVYVSDDGFARATYRWEGRDVGGSVVFDEDVRMWTDDAIRYHAGEIIGICEGRETIEVVWD